tara:strand:+ start:1320 stop:2858 length:1539 start_codon:yes stop_codon:yes gene_type:complete
MSNIGYDTFTGTLTADKVDADVIKWKTFDPVLTIGTTTTLALTLAAGNDANDSSIDNVGGMNMSSDLAMGSNAITAASNVSVLGMTNTNNLQVTTALVTGTLDLQSATTFNVPGTANMGTISATNFSGATITGCDLSSATNTFPPSINGDLEDTLQLGNDASGLNILNVGTLGATSVSAPQVIATTSLLANQMGGRNVNLNSDALNNATLDFTGNANLGQKTFIEGDDTQTGGVANMTKCTYLDLSDSTNFIGASDDFRTEWGAVWNDAETHYPPPPYADGSTFQILTQDQVCFDFNQGNSTNGTSGWRYFAPQSDGACQIDSDDHMELLAGQYIWDQTGGAPWEKAFRAVTAPTTNPLHSSQIVEFTFPSNEYGFGRIYFSLGYSIFGSSAEPTPIGKCFFLNHEKEGSALGTNPRLNGTITVKWYVPNTFPTDGTRWNIFPLCRTDDSRTTKGHLLIRIGKGQPILDCNSANLPIFSPANSDAQTGQLLMRGYPLPSSFQEYPNYVPPPP